jgi:hypothetical protein
LTSHRRGDQFLGLVGDDVADRPQRPRQQPVRDELAPLVVFVAVTVECCAARQPVEIRFSPTPWPETNVVSSRSTALHSA